MLEPKDTGLRKALMDLMDAVGGQHDWLQRFRMSEENLIKAAQEMTERAKEATGGEIAAGGVLTTFANFKVMYKAMASRAAAKKEDEGAGVGSHPLKGELDQDILFESGWLYDPADPLMLIKRVEFDIGIFNVLELRLDVESGKWWIYQRMCNKPDAVIAEGHEESPAEAYWSLRTAVLRLAQAMLLAAFPGPRVDMVINQMHAALAV